MTLGFTLGTSPSLVPGERVLLLRKRVSAGSVKSPPTYRWFFSMPPLVEIDLWVTDQRVLLQARLFHLAAQEFSQWFGGNEAASDDEMVLSVRRNESRLLGPYVEIVSKCKAWHWWRSDALRLRIFTMHAEEIRNTVEGLIGCAR